MRMSKIRSNWCFWGPFAASLAALSPALAGPNFYAVNGANLLTVDPGAQTVNPIGAAGVDALQDIDFDNGGNLYAVRDFFGTNESYQINPATGEATLLNGSLGGSFWSLAYNHATGQFWSVSAATGLVGTLDLQNGDFLSPFSGPHNALFRMDGLAWSPAGALYGLYNENPTSNFAAPIYHLVSIDLNTGTSSFIGNIADGQRFRSLRFGDDGSPYTVDFNSGSVYRIDLTTGVGSPVFNAGFDASGITGLAIVPEPASILLLAIGGALLARSRRRD